MSWGSCQAKLVAKVSQRLEGATEQICHLTLHIFGQASIHHSLSLRLLLSGNAIFYVFSADYGVLHAQFRKAQTVNGCFQSRTRPDKTAACSTDVLAASVEVHPID